MVGDKFTIKAHQGISKAIPKGIDVLTDIYMAKEVDDDIRQKVKDLKYSISEVWNNEIYDICERHHKIKKLIGRYFILRSKSFYYEYYIMPYQFIESNSTLWMLYITTEKDPYKGGLIDGNKDIDEEWNVDLEFEEISKEEFYKKVQITLDTCISHRMNKLKNNPEEYDKFWKTYDFDK